MANKERMIALDETVYVTKTNRQPLPTKVGSL